MDEGPRPPSRTPIFQKPSRKKKKKKKKAEVVSTVPDCKRRSNHLQKGRRSRSHLFGILWNIRLEQFLTVRSRCSTERSQSQERDDHGHRHGCPRGPRTQEGERTAPPTELQRKKNTCLYFVPLSSWVLLKGEEQVSAGTADDCADVFCPRRECPAWKVTGSTASQRQVKQALLHPSRAHLGTVTKPGPCFCKCSGVAQQRAAFVKRQRK